MSESSGNRKSRRGRREQTPEVLFSKKLTWILRHKAVDLKLPIGPDGFVPCEAILRVQQLAKFSPTMDKLREAVANCSKQRFSLRETPGGEWEIRANQGHTIKSLDDHAMLSKITDAGAHPVVVHGTNSRSWLLIQASGHLSRMARRHVHFSSKHFGSKDMVSGMRQSSDILIHLDLARAMRAGLEFFKSANQVILCAGDKEGNIPLEYVAKVEQVVKNKNKNTQGQSNSNSNSNGNGINTADVEIMSREQAAGCVRQMEANDGKKKQRGQGALCRTLG